ncbi:DUF4430 domain-containing protein [Eubacterium coprostanoligenes]|uniref:Transcobalamin-like C-terminal domain-containing protein n=1 Tax=Eubacterium coprostanoligenes TaxID=290054 RepID=A0A1T4L6F3_9FIRM|nr:DUF4430 domain-containing protein [Eubacterium coprostanoligenes]SJZ50264.1 protein of unknown function [Eubacterium coprostanoligenes]
MNKKICALLLSAAMCFCFTACSNNTQEEQSTAVTATTTTQATTSTTVAETTTKETTAKPSTTKTQTTTKKKKITTTKVKKKKKTDTVTCTVTVECKSILDHMDELKEGHEEFVPSDGYIIKNYTYKAKAGYTAYDALKSACNNNDIKLTAQKTSYGVYISGINSLDEFDCGKQSGWMYSVNGIMPNTTCGNVTIDDGDSIVFTYVCTFQ